MPALMGMNAKLYRLSTGSRATWGTADADSVHQGAAPANLDEVGNITDVTLTLDKAEADVTTRGNNGWRARKGTLKDGTVEFEMIWDTADDDFAAFFGSWLNGTVIAVAVLDGAKTLTGTEGAWMDMEVFKFEKSEPLEQAQKVSVSLKPSYSTVAPEWVRVTGS